MARLNAAWDALRDFALTLPETSEQFPWGDRVIKVRGKIFVFLGEREAVQPKVSLKLGESHEVAIKVPGAIETGYGLGKSGWVTIPLGESGPSIEIFREWIVESFTLIAPKKLSSKL